MQHGLDLGFLETILPESSVGGHTILAEVNEDVPKSWKSSVRASRSEGGIDKHSFTVHAFAHHDIVVVPVLGDLLQGASRLRLPFLQFTGFGQFILLLLD